MVKNPRKKHNKYDEKIYLMINFFCLFKIKEGDIIDLVIARTEGAKYNSKRIIVYKVFDEKSLKNKVKVCLIAWRQGVEVDGSEWN
jgi:hypothetical protein